jgi:hypothetical protein
MNRDTAKALINIYGHVGALFNKATAAIDLEPGLREATWDLRRGYRPGLLAECVPVRMTLYAGHLGI